MNGINFDQLQSICDEWKTIGVNCERSNQSRARQAFALLYAKVNLPEPRIIWFDSPKELCDALNNRRAKWLDGSHVLHRDKFRNPPRLDPWLTTKVQSVIASARDMNMNVWDKVGGVIFGAVSSAVNGCMYGQHDADWLCAWDYLARSEPWSVDAEWVAAHRRIAENVGWWVPATNVVFATRKHVSLKLDEAGNVHDDKGAAIVYPDAWAVYSWHGMRVPEAVIAYPHAMSKRYIDDQPDGALKQLMIDRYGATRYWVETGARKLHEDEFGTLFQMPGKRVVRVVNSTPERDGTFKEYFIDVPPTVTRAREAVAWTFGMLAHEYEPAVES